MRSPPKPRSPSCAFSCHAIGGLSSTARRRSWRARPSGSRPLRRSSPDHAIARGRAGAGLLAHIVVSKYDDHLPLYRQAEIFARGGVSLETSTLSGWVGATAAALKPLVDALASDVLASDTLHVDDTPVPVLAPGTGKTKTGRLWTYVRDERPFGGSRPAAALFFYSPDRKGEHPQAHLTVFRGVIHADGYAGFNELFAGGRIVEAACWAHVRRKFFDVHAATGSAIAKEALDRIGQLYAVEKTVNGSPPDRRRQQRQLQSKPIAEALAAWVEQTVRQLSASPSSPRPSAICGRAGPRWCVASTTAAWRSTTIPPNAPCAVSPLAARIICLPAPMPEAAAPLQSTP